MTENELLASLVTLPILIEGKVAIITGGNYELLNPARDIEIDDNYNPLDYSVLVHEKYSRCIVYSTKNERLDYLVNKQIDDLRSGKIKLGSNYIKLKSAI